MRQGTGRRRDSPRCLFTRRIKIAVWGAGRVYGGQGGRDLLVTRGMLLGVGCCVGDEAVSGLCGIPCGGDGGTAAGGRWRGAGGVRHWLVAVDPQDMSIPFAVSSPITRKASSKSCVLLKRTSRVKRPRGPVPGSGNRHELHVRERVSRPESTYFLRDRPCFRMQAERRIDGRRMRPNGTAPSERHLPGRPASGGSARVIYFSEDDSMVVDII